MQITDVTVTINFALSEGFFYGTTRLVYMLTVMKLAILQPVAHFRKIMRELLLRNIYKSEFAYARCIDDLSSCCFQIIHLGKSSCMHSFAAPTTHILRF